MLNQVNLIGRIGKDPEVRSMQSGKKVATISLAVSERWKDQNGDKKEKTEWVTVVVFSEGLVKLIQGHVEKGMMIFVSGKLQTRKWTDKEGNDRYSTEVILNGYDAKLSILSWNEKKDEGYRDDLEDEIPF